MSDSYGKPSKPGHSIKTNKTEQTNRMPEPYERAKCVVCGKPCARKYCKGCSADRYDARRPKKQIDTDLPNQMPSDE